jgi:uncharacterized membrane protein YkvA (DUF1232 family)
MTSLRNRLRHWARTIKRDVVAVYLVARHPEAPWYAKLLAVAVAAYALSPIDLIPDFIPVLGYLDDVILVPLGVLVVAWLVPHAVMVECRAAAAQLIEQPVSAVAAKVIIALWVAAGLTAIWALAGCVRTGLRGNGLWTPDMDSLSIDSLVQDLASIVTAIAAVIGVGIAWRGLRSWRDEVRGRAKYGVARRVLRAVYEIRNGIAFVRSPLIREGEGGAERGNDDADRTRADRERRDFRWQTVARPMADLQLALLDAEVLFGSPFADAFKELHQLVHELGLNRRYLAEGLANPEMARARGEAWEKIGNVALWSGPTDEFEARLNEIIARIEGMVRPHV